MIPRTLSMTQPVHGRLRQHLFPGDGKEAAAVLVCTPAGTSAARRPRVRSQTSQSVFSASRRTMAMLMVPVPPMKRAFIFRDHLSC